MAFFDRVEKNLDKDKHSAGMKMRKMRLMKNISVKEMGKACGVNDTAIRNYELGIRQPSDEKLSGIADCLGINVSALYDRKIKTYEDAIHILFELEEDYGISPFEVKETPFYGIISQDEILAECFKKWYEKRKELENHEINNNEYDCWKSSFPCDDKEFPYSGMEVKRSILNEQEMRIEIKRLLRELGWIIFDKLELIENNVEKGNINTALHMIDELRKTVRHLLESEAEKFT